MHAENSRSVDLYGDHIEIDYRGEEVNVENFIRVLTGLVLPNSVLLFCLTCFIMLRHRVWMYLQDLARAYHSDIDWLAFHPAAVQEDTRKARRHPRGSARQRRATC